MGDDNEDEWQQALLDLADAIDVALAPSDPNYLTLQKFLLEHVAALPLGDSVYIEVSSEFAAAHSCALGVAGDIMQAPFLTACLRREALYGFSLMVLTTGEVISYLAKNAVQDKLLNNFCLGYFRPVEGAPATQHPLRALPLRCLSCMLTCAAIVAQHLTYLTMKQTSSSASPWTWRMTIAVRSPLPITQPRTHPA